MYKRTLAAFVLPALTVTFTGSAQTPQTQPAKPAEQKAPLSDAELTARTDKRRALQWYAIEPMTPCAAGAAKRMREQGEDPIDVRRFVNGPSRFIFREIRWCANAAPKVPEGSEKSRKSPKRECD